MHFSQNLKYYATLLLTTLYCLSSPSIAEQDKWYPSRFGAEDTLGAINFLSPEKTLQAVELVREGKTYSLGVATGKHSPTMSHRRFDLTVVSFPPIGDEQITGNDDLFSGWMGTGSQIDGLGHVGYANRYYNGIRGEEFIRVTGLTKFGIDKLPPIVTRGVLLDMAKYFDMEMLPEGKAIDGNDLKAAAKSQGINIQQGDVVLLHTGWMNLAGVDNDRFMSGEPGINTDGATYLAELGVVAIGSDTWAVEVKPSREKQAVHPLLIAKYGVYLLENMDTRQLAADGAYEFLFVLGQPKFEGAVQAIINPVAIR